MLPFKAKDESMGFNIAELLEGQLLASRFTVIERSQLQALLDEQKMSIDGIIEGRESFVGKLRGVDALILGSVTISNGFAGLAYGGDIDYVSACTARIVDTRTGEVILAVNVSSGAPNTWSGILTPAKAAEKLAKQIVDR